MSKKLRIGELLLKEGILSRQQLEEALNAQLIYGGKLGTNLVEHGFVTEEFLTSFLSKQCNVPAVGIEKLENIPSEVIKSITRDLAERHKVIPFRKDKRRLDVALVDPTNLKAIDEVAFKTGLLTRPHVAPEVTILRCLERYYHIPTRRRYIHIETEKEPGRFDISAGLATSIDANPQTGSETPHPNGSLLTRGETPGQGGEVPIGLPDAFPDRPMNMMQVVCELQSAEASRQITDLILRFGRPFFSNRSVLMRRADSFELVASEGSSAYGDRTKKLTVPIEEQNIIQTILTTKRYHLGTLPANPENFQIVEQFGEEPSSMFLVLPLIYNQRVEFILFASAPTHIFTLDCVRLFQLMVEKASLTHQILLLKSRLLLLPDDLN
jgi:hypothetical protein